MQRRIFLAMALMLPGTLLSAETRERAVKLGHRNVRWLGDRDIIHVGLHEGEFRRIFFTVEDNDIFIHKLNVIYSNGVDDFILIEWHIPAGEQSRVIDLRADERNIRRVEFSYRRVTNFDGPAEVTLWGLR
jgi:hypothetical protein